MALREGLPGRRRRLTALVGILPQTNHCEILPPTTSLAVLAILSECNPNLRADIDKQTTHVQASVEAELTEQLNDDGKYVLTRDQLRGIMARAVIAGAAQTAYDAGEALQEIQELNMGIQGDAQSQ